MWVETAMNLTRKELRIMERLAKAQVQRSSQNESLADNLRDKHAI
jgi:hypothetical protein